MSTFTSPTHKKASEREWETIVHSYSFITIVSILKNTLVEKDSFHKENEDFQLIYGNLMKYIRKHANLQSKDPSIQDKDIDELRGYSITNSKLKRLIDFMWEESTAFPVYLILSIIKGWIVHKEFEYCDDEAFLRYIEEGLQVNINDILFLIRMKDKKVGTLNRDEKIRLLTINEMIRKKSMKSDDVMIIGSSDNMAIFTLPKTKIIHSTAEEDAWLLEQIEQKIHQSS
jgi:hypothetical protein